MDVSETLEIFRQYENRNSACLYPTEADGLVGGRRLSNLETIHETKTGDDGTMTLHLSSDSEPEPLPRTHNNPPEPIAPRMDLSPEQWSEWMAHVYAGLIARRAELQPTYDRFFANFPTDAEGLKLWDDEIQGRAGDLRNRYRDLVKQAEALHAVEKAPILAASRAVDGYKTAFVQPLSAIIALIQRRQTEYATHVEALRRKDAEEAARKAQEEADRIAREAMARQTPQALDAAAKAEERAEELTAQAAAPAADLTRTHGALGSVTSLRTTWKFDAGQSDLAALVAAVAAGQAPMDYLTFNANRINYAVRSEKVRKVPGLAIIEEKVAR